PVELATDLTAYVGCIAGAISIEEYRRGLRAAGFAAVEIVETGSDLNAYAMIDNQAACCTPAGSCSPPQEPLHARLTHLLARYNVNDYAASVRVYAIKPEATLNSSRL